ncbi:MAG TPA: GNAT family N-acetyltransferase [Pseudomonas sp.]|uniref:GNAT family N-acetyltransferase n=1 Tax=Pseudomonas sp. TaxID=306 RepID=UPI002CD537DD|nr:GNAT family N-acetyltransferase [Pseudomonas sp.]HSX88325.1 GNAT family N-acetyltransferase [Pseudomonas sp.]
MSNFSSLADGIGMRPAAPSDEPFLQGLYQSSRADLQWIDGDAELIDTVIANQYQVQQAGMGNQYPNAMHLIVEKAGSAIGAVTVDFGHNEVRLIYLALIPAARGRGYGKVVLQGVQRAAQQVASPVAVVVWRNNVEARRLYLELGFRVEETQPVADRLVWYPSLAFS